MLRRALPETPMDDGECDRLAHILLMAFDGFIVRSHVGGTRPDMPGIVVTMAKLVAGRPMSNAASLNGARRRKPARARTAQLTRAH
jgi:hypothetical protein